MESPRIPTAKRSMGCFSKYFMSFGTPFLSDIGAARALVIIIDEAGEKVKLYMEILINIFGGLVTVQTT